MFMHGEVVEPLNLGSNELVSINQLVDIVEGIRGREAQALLQSQSSEGVNGRNSDNTLIKQPLRLGAGHAAARWAGEDLRVDLRRDQARREEPVKSSPAHRAAACPAPSEELFDQRVVAVAAVHALRSFEIVGAL